MAQSPRPQPTLRPIVYVAGGVLVVLLGVALWKLPLLLPLAGSLLGVPKIQLPEQEPGTTPLPGLPESFKAQPKVYGTPPPPPKEKPPVATPLTRPPTAPPPPTPPPPAPAPAAPAQRAQVEPLPPFLQPQPGPPAGSGSPVTPATGTQGTGGPQAPQLPPKEKPQDARAKKWEFLVKADPGKQGQPPSPERVAELGRRVEEQTIIRPARWAVPIAPLRTLYRSQTLNGRLLQTVISDVPGGQVKMQLTTPTLDKFGYDTTIIPKDAIVIASTTEKPATYGQTRLQIKLEQLEYPSGEVVVFKAYIGDHEGANGLPGHVNNHYGKLILATGLSAVLNIGVRAAAGTPGRGDFFQNPAQGAAQDIGQSIQQDAKSIVDRELRVPPTITVPTGTFCTINLQENIQFNRPPTVAR